MKKLLLLLLIVGCAHKPKIPILIPIDYQPPLYKLGMTLKEFKSNNTDIWLHKKDNTRAIYYKWEFPSYAKFSLNNNPCEIIKMGYYFKKNIMKQNVKKYHSNYSCPENCSIDHIHFSNISNSINEKQDQPYILHKVRQKKDLELIKYRKNCTHP